MKKPPLDVAAATNISNSGRLKLSDVVFVALSAQHVGAAPDDAFTLDWNVSDVAALWELEDGRELKVMFPMSLHIAAFKDIEPTVKTKIAEVSVVFRLDYRLSGELDDGLLDQLQDFVGICGYMHLWPYFRSEVQWLTTKLGFPSLVLPLVLSGDAAKRVTVQNASEVKRALAASTEVKPKPQARTRTLPKKT